MQRRSIFATMAAIGLLGALVPVALAASRSDVVPPEVEFSYYDGHIDAYIETDISSQKLAQQLGINYSPVMAAERAHEYPPQFEFRGPAAAGQLTVFGSEPGEKSYTPFWDLVFVRWNPGVTPVLVTVDDQIDRLAAQGKITVRRTPILTNAPIIGVDVTMP